MGWEEDKKIAKLVGGDKNSLMDIKRSHHIIYNIISHNYNKKNSIEKEGKKMRVK